MHGEHNVKKNIYIFLGSSSLLFLYMPFSSSSHFPRLSSSHPTLCLRLFFYEFLSAGSGMSAWHVTSVLQFMEGIPGQVTPLVELCAHSRQLAPAFRCLLKTTSCVLRQQQSVVQRKCVHVFRNDVSWSAYRTKLEPKEVLFCWVFPDVFESSGSLNDQAVQDCLTLRRKTLRSFENSMTIYHWRGMTTQMIWQFCSRSLDP